MGIYFGYGAFGSFGAYDNYDKSACKNSTFAMFLAISIYRPECAGNLFFKSKRISIYRIYAVA